MSEIKCPNCGKVFSVDEASYASVVNQVRTREFHADVERRVKEMEKQQELLRQSDIIQAEQAFQPNRSRNWWTIIKTWRPACRRRWWVRPWRPIATPSSTPPFLLSCLRPISRKTMMHQEVLTWIIHGVSGVSGVQEFFASKELLYSCNSKTFLWII